MAIGPHPRARAKTSASDPGGGEAAERVPDEVLAQAKEAFGRQAGGPVASLVSDSLVEDNAPPEDHRLRFEHPLMRFSVHVSAGASGSSVSGRVDPPTPLRIELCPAAGDIALVDHVVDGAFSFDQVGHDVIRLRAVGRDGLPPVHTEWFRV